MTLVEKIDARIEELIERIDALPIGEERDTLMDEYLRWMKLRLEAEELEHDNRKTNHDFYKTTIDNVVTLSLGTMKYILFAWGVIESMKFDRDNIITTTLGRDLFKSVIFRQ